MQKDIKEIFKNSGNNFHYKVVDFLREKGWVVTVSPYYNDNFTEKPREIDIIAQKEYEVSYFQGFLGYINVRLFIECKYMTNDIIFWFDKKNMEKSTERVLKDTPLEDPARWSMTNNHRYLEDILVAKIFDSGTKQIAENELIYKAIIQSLNSTVYYRGNPTSFSKNNFVEKILVTLNYPIIICNNFDKLYKYDTTTKGSLEIIKDNFQYEINYAYKESGGNNRNEYFLVDIVSYDNIEELLMKIENSEIKAIKEKLSWDKSRTKTIKVGNNNFK